MRVLIVSDTHGKNGNLEKVLRLIAPLDLIFHLGDLEAVRDILKISRPVLCIWSAEIMIFLRLCRQRRLWS